MRVGKELLELVKSLTIGENYAIRIALPPVKAAMYDLLRGMSEYDPKVVKAAFPNYTDQNISTTQHQLINMIAEILWHGLHKHGMRDLVQRIGETEIFMKKSLFKLAAVKAKEAIKLAIGLEAGHELLLAIRLRHEVQGLLNIKDEDPAATATLVRAAKQGIEERNLVEDWFIRVSALDNMPIADRKAEIARLELEISNTPYPTMRRNRIRYHRCRHILAFKTGQLDTCMLESAQLVAQAEEAPPLMGDVQLRGDYFTSLHFMIALWIERGDFDAAENHLAQMERAAGKWANGIASDPSLQGRHTHATLSLLLHKNDWEQARQRARQVLAEMIVTGGKLNLRHRPAWLQMAISSAFLTRDFTTVRKFTVSLRETLSGIIVSDNFLSGLGLYYLASLYEEQDEFLEAATNQTKRWYVERGCMGPVETRMLQFFQKASKGGDPKRNAPLLQKLKEDLAVLFEEPLLWRRREVFPVLHWVDAQLQGVDIRTLLFPKTRV